MLRDSFVLKTKRELCQPKSFGTLEKRDPAPRGFSPITCVFFFQQKKNNWFHLNVPPSDNSVRERRARARQLVPRISRARLLHPYFHLQQKLETRGPFLDSLEKPFLKLRPAYSIKLVFSHVVKGIKIKIIAMFRASIRLRLEDTKRIMPPEMRPKSCGTFEKRALAVESTDT